MSTLGHLVTAVVFRGTTQGTHCVISQLPLCKNIFLKKKVLKQYTIMYVKKLLKQTLENLRNSV
jgi:hypothetical protein